MTTKTTISDLALLGGTPMFAHPVHVGAPNIPDTARITALLDGALKRRWLTNDGPLVQEFEHSLAERLGVRRCVATCNATSALMLLARALHLRGEVAVPAFTFVGTAHALAWQGLAPVFCDIDPDTWTIDPADVDAVAGEAMSGVLGVHLFGRSCDVAGLQEVAAKRGLRIMYDAAHAFGSSHDAQPIGRFGAAEVFSFHATKVCNAFEGGAISTDDVALADELASLRNFGFHDIDTVTGLGINAKMSEASAAMGIASLESVDHFIAANATNLDRYREGLQGIAGVTLRDADPAESNCHYVVVDVDRAKSGLGRDDLCSVLWAENVLARRYFFPGCHRAEPYRSMPSVAARELPVTDAVLSRVLVLPTGTATSPEAVDQICALMRWCVEQGEEVTDALRRQGSR